jgi:VCBS repeat-containing protein
MFLARVFSGLRLTPGRRASLLVRSRYGADGSAAVAGAGWAGGLSFVGLILSALKEARAADPDVTLFDHGTITYKDFEHGSFELVTKEAVPRHIVVDDPEQTVVLTKTGSSVSFAQTANNAARMEDLQAAQQDVLANYTREHGQHGSGTPPGETANPAPEPINFVVPGGSVLQQSLPALVSASFVPDTFFIQSPPPTPTLTLGSSPVEVDTIVFDKFSASIGSFSASFGSGVTPIFGVAGGAVGPVVIAGATYDVEKPGSYGTLYLNSASGAYTYVPNNDAINALKVSTTDNFTITASDGLASASQTFTVDIDGVNDASVVSGVAIGSVVEAAAGAHGVPSASGMLTDTDVDDPANTFTAVSSPHVSDHSYGSFTITTNGHWTYTLDDSNPAVQALNASETLTDTFTVTTIGGTPEVVTVTIQGSNDPAVVSGDTHGYVVEAGGVHNATHGVPTATGLLTDTDVDDPSNTFVAVTSPQPSDHGYGSFAMTADGLWTYTLDNANCAVQALNVGQTLTDTFVVKTVDGTAQTVAITIEGSNDAAVVSGDTHGCVVEAGGVHNATHGVPTATGLLTDTDVDDPSNTFVAVTSPQPSDHGYGSFAMTTDGLWTYTLDNANCAVQALNVGQTLTDTFVVKTVDGTAQTVAITIEGSNDAAVVSGETRGCVVEPSKSCDPPPSASGTLTDRDVDNPDNTFAAVTCAQASDHGYGSFTMTASGTWTYVLDEGNPAVKSLNACDTLTDTFTVATIDGTVQTVTVTIQGADDTSLHDFLRQANSSFRFKDDADLQQPSASAPSADPSAAAGPHDSWLGSFSEGGGHHPADAAPDAFHFPGHGDAADSPAAIVVALHASHHDLIA